MGGISRRQSRSMTGSISDGLASRPQSKGGVSIDRRREAFLQHPWTESISTTTWGRHLDRTPARGISQHREWREASTYCRHLNRLRREASRSLAGERRFTASERIDDGKPRPIVGISIARRREAFHSPCGGSISVSLAVRAH